MADEKVAKDDKALNSVLSQITRQYGDGSIMRLGGTKTVNVDVIPTGSLSLDKALGIGGFPKGRVVEIFGAEASGKTTLALHVAAEAQKRGGVVAFIDAEHALDPLYAKRLGVDIDNLLISQPDTGEQALEITDMLVRSGAVEVVVIDSVAALVPRVELEGEMGDVHVGLQARLMSQALRKLTGNIHKSRTCVVFINQVRQKIGVMYGNPMTTPGGMALKFSASLRLEVRKIENIKRGTDIIGVRTGAKVVKNKFAPPFKQAEFDIIFGTGICKYGDLIDMALAQGVLEQRGTWFVLGEERVGQGKERVRQSLQEDSKLFNKILNEVKKKIKVPAA
ncbi:MAG: recombinase RecA [bacterium]